MTGSIANCTQCGSQTFVEPLHGERGGPPYCPICAGAWHAEHGRKRRVARTLIKVMLAYDKAGGKLYDKEFDELKIAACDSGVAVYDADARAAADEFRDLTTELLTATLALTHPDKHPPELKAEANRVTQELLALKPFVFPAPALPAPAPKKPKPDSDELDLSSLKNFRQTYPCEACRDAVTFDYCDTCRAEYEKREREESEKRTKKQRAEYKLRRKLALAEREQRKCATCGMKFRVSRTDARYCSNPCRLSAHRKKQALETDKHSRTTQPSFIRFKSLENRILAVLKKHPAVFLNDILPVERTRAEYQALCLAAVKLEDEGRIESLSYWCRYSRPGHKVLHRPGYEIKDSHKIPRLKREA